MGMDTALTLLAQGVDACVETRVRALSPAQRVAALDAIVAAEKRLASVKLALVHRMSTPAPPWPCGRRSSTPKMGGAAAPTARPLPDPGQAEIAMVGRRGVPNAVDFYGWLAEHQQRPTFAEHIRARLPIGDETTSLHMTPGTALLVITRITITDRPLALEEIRVPGDTADVAYPLPVTGRPSRTGRGPTTRTTTAH